MIVKWIRTTACLAGLLAGTGCTNGTGSTDPLQIPGEWDIEYYTVDLTTVSTSGTHQVTRQTDTLYYGGAGDRFTIAQNSMVASLTGRTDIYNIVLTDSTVAIQDGFLDNNWFACTDTVRYRAYISNNRLFMELQGTYESHTFDGTWTFDKTLRRYDFVLSPTD